MTTVFPGALDSYADKVDGVDDVMAAHVNDMQDAIEAIELHFQTKGMMTRIRNTSGATVAANDIGYIDEAGEFKTTTTAYLDAAWCVVISGAANNSDIIVCRKGRVTIELNGNCSAGDYLYTSTTTGQAQPQSYMRPEVFAVALTANVSGAGGTCEALLLTSTITVMASSTSDIHFANAHSSTLFVATINGAPSSTSVVYNAPGAGNEDCIVPLGGPLLAYQRLHNTTRSDYRLIVTVNAATNTITTVASTDSWANGDTITIESQTATSPLAYKFIDLDFSQQSTVPILARGVIVEAYKEDSGGASRGHVHPFVTYAGAKLQGTQSPSAGVRQYRLVMIALVQRCFVYRGDATGGSTAADAFKLTGYYLAAP